MDGIRIARRRARSMTASILLQNYDHVTISWVCVHYLLSEAIGRLASSTPLYHVNGHLGNLLLKYVDEIAKRLAHRLPRVGDEISTPTHIVHVHRPGYLDAKQVHTVLP
jgi:hypothetical protein